MVSFLKEPCGIFCVLLTYISIVFADYCFIEHVIVPTMSNSILGVINVLIFNIFIILLAVSHFRATTCDPGKVPLPSTTLDFSDMHQGDSLNKGEDTNNWTVCSRCETYRPPRAHHCRKPITKHVHIRICGRCIQKMDHHCPWINNCVGEGNQKYFVLFLVYTGICSLHAILIGSISFSLPCIDCSNDYASSTRNIYTISLIIEGLLFGLFVIALLCDQFSSICSDTTAVEYVQKRSRNNKKTRIELLIDVFGKGPSISWMLPCVSPNLSTKTDSDKYYLV